MTNNRTAKASLTKSVTTLNNFAPSALISTSTIVGYDVTVSSTSTDSDGTIAEYRWGWGDSTANSTTDNATHTYARVGTYTITLIVVDNDGATSSM